MNVSITRNMPATNSKSDVTVLGGPDKSATSSRIVITARTINSAPSIQRACPGITIKIEMNRTMAKRLTTRALHEVAVYVVSVGGGNHDGPALGPAWGGAKTLAA